MLRKILNKVCPSIPTGVFAELLVHYGMNRKDYWNLVEFRSPIFNGDGYEHVSGLYIKSANLAEDIAVYDFYYGGLYLFSIRLSTDTGESICVYYRSYGQTVMTLVSPYGNLGYSGHPEYSDVDFVSL